MARPRVTETAQRQSPRCPPNARSSGSDSDQSNPRLRTEKNQKPTEIRSARSGQPEPSNKKKLGTRIANLESQLGLAQEELKSLKDQLVSNKAIKKATQDQFDNKPKQIEPETLKKDDSLVTISQETSVKKVIEQETDVFEVAVEKLAVESKAKPETEVGPESPAVEDEFNSKSIHEANNQLLDEVALKDEEINLLKASLDDKDKELEILRLENESLKSQSDNKSLDIASAQAEIDRLTLRLADSDKELERSKNDGIQISEKLEQMEKAKEELESEMRRLRVQSEQWRKAADAAAAVLAGGSKTGGGGRLPERCGSMDKVYVGPFEHGGYGGYVGSPGLGDEDAGDDGLGGERRRGPGIRMLWKKKGGPK